MKISYLSDDDYNALQGLLKQRVELVTEYQRYKERHRNGELNDSLAVKVGYETSYKISKERLDRAINNLSGGD